MPGDDGARAASYRERLWPEPYWWLIAPGLGFGGFAAVFPIDLAVAIVVGVVIAILVAIALARFSPVLEIRDGVLYAGTAHIELSHFGDGREVHGADFRHEMGPGLDARTWLYTRPWVKSAVFITIEDPADPTPAWLLATRAPAELLAAIAAGKRQAHSEQIN